MKGITLSHSHWWDECGVSTWLVPLWGEALGASG